MSKLYTNFAQYNGSINNGANNNTIEWIRLKNQSFYGAASNYDFNFNSELNTSNCEVWKITWQQCQQTTDNVNINIRFSSNNGAAYSTTGRLISWQQSTDNSFTVNANETGECVVHRNQGNDLWSRGFGYIQCNRRGRESADAHYMFYGATWRAANSGFSMVEGAYAITGDHDAVRFIPTSGNIDQIEVTLWGKYIANTNHGLHT